METDDFEENDDNLKSFHIVIKKTITTYVDIRAESMNDAMDMCSIGVSVNENDTLDARGDMEEHVESYGVDDVEEEILYEDCYEN